MAEITVSGVAVGDKPREFALFAQAKNNTNVLVDGPVPREVSSCFGVWPECPMPDACSPRVQALREMMRLCKLVSCRSWWIW